jgi:hypothetical protein
MDLQEVECGGVDEVKLTQDRERGRSLLIVIMNFRVP